MALSYKKIFIQSIFTQINFRLQFSITVLCISENSTGNICVSIKVDCILRKKPNKALREMTSPYHGLMTSFLELKKLWKEFLGESRPSGRPPKGTFGKYFCFKGF